MCQKVNSSPSHRPTQPRPHSRPTGSLVLGPGLSSLLGGTGCEKTTLLLHHRNSIPRQVHFTFSRPSDPFTSRVHTSWKLGLTCLQTGLKHPPRHLMTTELCIWFSFLFDVYVYVVRACVHACVMQVLQDSRRGHWIPWI